MASRWKWFLGGGVCGVIVGVLASAVFLLLNMTVELSGLPGADLIAEDEVHWEESGEPGARVHQQVDEQGHPHGYFRRFGEGGRLLSEGLYVRSNPEGHWVWWGPDGSWSAVGGLLDGHEDGTWIVWDPADLLEAPVSLAVVSYRRGIKQGPLTAWRADGSLDPEVTGWYEDDERVRDLEAEEIHHRPGG